MQARIGPCRGHSGIYFSSDSQVTGAAVDVERNYVVAGLRQSVDSVTTDETRIACDEDAHAA